MFSPAVIKCQWLEDEAEERADYVELVPVPTVGDLGVLRFLYGHLQTGPNILAKVNESNNFPNATGGLRLLVLERHRYAPLDFSLQESTFRTICQRFQLSDKTLQVFDCDAGSFSRSFCYDETGRITGIGTWKT
jgi:hypothetical protein